MLVQFISILTWLPPDCEPYDKCLGHDPIVPHGTNLIGFPWTVMVWGIWCHCTEYFGAFRARVKGLHSINCHMNAQFNCTQTTFILAVITAFWSLCKAANPSRGTTLQLQKPVQRTIESGSGFLCFSLQLSLESSRVTGLMQAFYTAKKQRGKNICLKYH